MTFDQATAKAAQLTVDRDLVGEIALLVIEAVAIERAASIARTAQIKQVAA